MKASPNNPLRYRGYYYDVETGLYYLQSRYYDPQTGRFINADDASYIGADGSFASYNLFAYCNNNPIMNVDPTGEAAINVVFAAIGAIVGWQFGAWVANKLGYYNGWKYWTIRAGVVAGGAVLGWFAGSLLAKLVARYLKNNPSVVFKLIKKMGVSTFNWAMKFFGINPFALATNGSKFIALARIFNSKTVTIAYSWAVELYKAAKRLGYKIGLDSPHGGYSWHIHLSGANGKLSNLHIQITKKAWDYLAKLLK